MLFKKSETITTEKENLKEIQLESLLSLQIEINKAIFKYPDPLPISAWADKYRYLSREASSEPGKWRTSRAPFQKGPMNAVMDPKCNMVVIEAATQMLKTEVILNIIGRFMHLDPCPMLIVQPTLDLAKTFSKDRLYVMLRDTPVLKKLMPNLERSHDSDSTILHKRFPGGHITMAGANSASSLAMRPIKILFLDEIDRYPDMVGSEGDPIELAIKRTATFYNKKHIMTSSPTIKGKSKIHKYFLLSNQSFFYVPCPRCKTMQTLFWKRLKWNKETIADNKYRIKNVHYECIKCNFAIEERHKTTLLKAGRWIARYPFTDNGIKGFHINELYSPFKTWKELVQTFLDSKNDVSKLQVFINTSLAQEFEERGESPDWEIIFKREKNYSKNKVPTGGLVLVAGVDVQTDRIETEIKAYGKNKQSWSIDYRIFHGNPENFKVWEALDRLLEEDFPHESGGSMRIQLLAIDSGFATNDVYAFGRRHGLGRVMVLKGVSSINEMVGKPTIRDFDYRGQLIKKGIRLFGVNVNKIKGQLFSFLRSEDKGMAGYMSFPIQYTQEYYKQLTAETLIKSKNRHGFYRYEYKKIRDRNEVLDTNVYARAASVYLGLDHLTDMQWERLKRDILARKKGYHRESDKGVRVISKGVEV